MNEYLTFKQWAYCLKSLSRPTLCELADGERHQQQWQCTEKQHDDIRDEECTWGKHTHTHTHAHTHTQAHTHTHTHTWRSINHRLQGLFHGLNNPPPPNPILTFPPHTANTRRTTHIQTTPHNRRKSTPRALTH